jgi:hypothetical protein
MTNATAAVLNRTMLRLAEELAALRNAGSADQWPKTTAQFAAYVGRDVRTVQGWIDAGLLRANTRVRPALITRGQAERFLEGSEKL